MRSYYRVRLGHNGEHAAECFAGGWVGVSYRMEEDLKSQFTEDMRDFNRKYIPILLARRPSLSKGGAAVACSALWTMGKGIRNGDCVLSPDAAFNYRVGEVSGDYYYVAGHALQQRRKVTWLDKAIPRSAMSDALRKTVQIPLTICNVTPYQAEIEGLLGMAPMPGVTAEAGTAAEPGAALEPGAAVPPIPTGYQAVVALGEDPVAFALEKYLENFLVDNWNQTLLGRDYTILEAEGERVGQQYPTDTGPIDILAVSRDKKRLLVVELKRGRASDVAVGQILRYMGYVQEEVAESGQEVEGAIIAFEDDPRTRRAVSAVPSVSFYRYEVNFKLVKA